MKNINIRLKESFNSQVKELLYEQFHSQLEKLNLAHSFKIISLYWSLNSLTDIENNYE